MPPPRGIRKVERWLVGIGMAVVAFILEKAIVRGLKRRGERTPSDEQPPTTLTSHGGSVDV
jgi:hypothetical protein